MLTPIKNVKNAIEKAREIEEQYILYVLNGKGFPRSVDDLLWICTEYLQKKINTKELKNIAENNSIRGVFTFNKDKNEYNIFLSGEPTDCKQRFVLCKEIFHVLLDEEKFRDMNLYDHLEEIMLSDPAMSSTPRHSVVSEQMAEWAAMEFLFPYKHRVSQLSSFHDIPDKDYYDIAKDFMVPQYLVEKYLSEQHMAIFEAFDSGNTEQNIINK